MTTNPLSLTIENTIQHHAEHTVSLRRHFHQNPELSRHEFKTTATLLQHLRDLGLDNPHTRPEGPGFFVDITPPHFDPSTHPTVAIRTDIDALAILEKTGLPFASSNEGVMHACGHDMHMACVFGATRALQLSANDLPGRIRVFYQHAEEVAPGGALDLIKLGCMDGVSRVLGLHCDPTIPVGQIGIRTGAFTASADTFELAIHGRSGHSARPHNCVDAVFLATRLLSDLYHAAGRLYDARKPVVIAFGAIHGGSAHNVISDHVSIKGTVRTTEPAYRKQVENLFTRTAQAVTSIYGGHIDIDFNEGSPAIINDAAVVNTIEGVARRVVGAENIVQIDLPSMGAEDFSEYLQHAPGAMFRLGVARPELLGDDDQFLHSPHFNPHEDSISIGSRILALTAVDLLNTLRN